MVQNSCAPLGACGAWDLVATASHEGTLTQLPAPSELGFPPWMSLWTAQELSSSMLCRPRLTRLGGMLRPPGETGGKPPALATAHCSTCENGKGAWIRPECSGRDLKD